MEQGLTMHLFGFKLLNSMFWKEWISFRSLVIISPVFLLTVKHWANFVILVLLPGSLFFLYKKKFALNKKLHNWRMYLSITLVAPLLSVLIGQSLRYDFYLPNLDSPLRLTLCFPIFLAISFGWLNNTSKFPISYQWITYSFPAALLFTYFNKSSWSSSWGEGRITTYFVDVISFGHLTLLFSLFVVYSFYEQKIPKNIFIKLFLFSSFIAGIYLSTMSASRTGWAFVPIFFIFMCYKISRNYSFNIFIYFVIPFLLILLFFAFNQPLFVEKINEVYIEISGYKFYDVNYENKVGSRLSFYRMAIFYFFQNPISGWGDLGWLKIIDSPEIIKYTTAWTRDFARNGFHNEILTNSVRSGIWGALSSTNLLIAPMMLYLFKRNFLLWENIKIISSLLLIFSFHMFIAGMTTEVTNLVFLSSFYGLTFSVLFGEAIFKLNGNLALESKV
jgi:O-antigen ligase